MADMNYVSPLTSDLTDYYTKSEVDELQQGDAATYATSAEIVAGDNAVKGWVASQGYLTEHQDLTNYATKDYVAATVEDIEVGGGVRIEVVATLPAHPEENVIYLTRKSESDTDNIYNEWIWVADTESYELIGDTSSGVIPDLTDYATKQWVEAKGYLDSSALIGYATVSDLGDFATKDYVDGELANKANSATLAAVATSGDYEDLINKPTIPSLTGYATQTYVNNAVSGITIPDVSEFATESFVDAGINNAINNLTGNLSTVATTGSYNDLTNKPAIPTVPANVSAFTNDAGYLTAHQDISGKANTADLATVAFSGDYDDLANKPSIPSTSGLASESYVDAAIGNLSIPTSLSDLDNDMNFVDEPMAKAAAIEEINNNVSAAGLSGDYDDLINKPTIPVLPTLATVATSGSYNDLSDKPIIPSGGISQVYASIINPFNMDVNVLSYTTFAVNYNSTIENHMNEVKTEFLNAIKNGKWVRFIAVASAGTLVLSNTDLGLANNRTIYLYSFNYSTKTWQGSQGYQLNLSTNRTYGYINNGVFISYPVDIYEYGGSLKYLPYSNTTSGLTATTIQGAIDELAASSGGASTAAQLSYDNTNTWNDGTDTDTVQEAIDNLWNDVDSMVNDLDGFSERVSDVETSITALPSGYKLSETYDATNKTLTLSVVASRK